jgi:hypothetical protein
MQSPTLKTLYIGHDWGVAKMSPRNSRWGCWTAPEFTNPSAPATWRAMSGSAGMTPPFAAMAMKFRAPPSMMIGTPGIRRLLQANAPRIA